MPKTRREIAREVDEILRSGPGGRTSKASHHRGRLRGDPLSTAAGIVVDRVRSSNAYQRGRQEIVRAAIKAIGPSPSIEHLRALGGLTKIVSDQVDGLSIPGLDENLGSPMFPHTPRSQLRRELGTLRGAVQQTLAKQLRSK